MLSAIRRGAMLVCLAGICDAMPAFASTLYEATVERPAGTREALSAAFSDALTLVLIKVTGQAAISLPDPSLAAFDNPSSFVQQYGSAGEGYIRVQFDEDATRRAIDAAGLPIWSDERPETLIWLIADEPDGRIRLLTSGISEFGSPPMSLPGPSPDPGSDAVGAPESPSIGSTRGVYAGPGFDEEGGGFDDEPAAQALFQQEMRVLLASQADARGISVMLPVGDVTDISAVLNERRQLGLERAIVLASGRYAPDAILIGRFRGGFDSAAPVRWTMMFGNFDEQWRGSIDSGIPGFADRLATSLATFASERRIVDLEVRGISQLEDHARVEDYLTGIGIVESCRARRFAGDTVEYRLAVRGGSGRLAALLRDSAVVRAEAPSVVSDVLVYTFLPGGQGTGE